MTLEELQAQTDKAFRHLDEMFNSIEASMKGMIDTLKEMRDE